MWVKAGAKTGLTWSKIGAFFTAAEIFSLKIRNVDDRINEFIGSGVTSAILRIEEGPLGVIQGFIVGYGFMYAFEELNKQLEFFKEDELKYKKVKHDHHKKLIGKKK